MKLLLDLPPELVTIIVPMMMDCPRCGFSQPKDRFCANCGLDIDHFKPVPESKIKKLVQSAAFQVGAVVLVVIVLGSGIYTAQKEEIAQQLEIARQSMIASDADTNSTATPDSTAAPTTTAATESAQPTQPAAFAAPAEEPTGDIAGEQQAAVETVNAAEPAPAANNQIKNLNIQFVEIPRLLAEQIASENQILDRSGNTYSFVLMSQPTPGSLGTGIRTLPGSANRPAIVNQKIELSFQSPQGQSTGMIMDVSTLNIGEQDIEFDIVSQVALWDAGSEKIANVSFNGKYTIPKGSTLVIVGLLPHQQIRQEDIQLFGNTPLSIMASPGFRNSTTEFAVVIQPK